MALNVSPQPDGRIPVDAWDSLNGFGQWMKTFGDAIYGTRVCAPYQSGTLSFTQKGDSVYVFRLYPTVQESVETEIFVPYTEAKISEICMVENGETVAFKEVEGGLCITVPAGYRRGSAPIALVLSLIHICCTDCCRFRTDRRYYDSVYFRSCGRSFHNRCGGCTPRRSVYPRLYLGLHFCWSPLHLQRLFLCLRTVGIFLPAQYHCHSAC